MHEQDPLSRAAVTAGHANPEIFSDAPPAGDGGSAPPPPPVGGAAEPGSVRVGSTPGAGASPSNTAPANCIAAPESPSTPFFKLLRFGIDSLYLSYPGTLSPEWEGDLDRLKRLAQSSDPMERALAQVALGGHLFEVRDKGKGRYPYVLVDNCYHLQLSSRSAKSLPLAYVQLSSELLTAVSVQDAEPALRFMVNTLGRVDADPQISRVDLFADFVSHVSMESWNRAAWVTRAQDIDTYSRHRAFTGWSIGLGGTIGARLYDKTLELRKSRKDYLKPLWSASGWAPHQSVWRLEFQLRREILKELGAGTLPALLALLPGLWRYATSSWLRLTLPNPQDQTQTRWPNHPLWERLAEVPWEDWRGPRLGRLRKPRLPSDESLFVNGLGGVTSFMASQGITDLGEGFGEYLAHAERFHNYRIQKDGHNFRRYIAEKVADKSRRFNTLRNQTRTSENEQDLLKQQKAAAYRLAKDGEV